MAEEHDVRMAKIASRHAQYGQLTDAAGTYPDSYATSRYEDVDLLLAWRDCLENAKTFMANKAMSYVIFNPRTDRYYQLFAHNGVPFADMTTILDKGLRPNRSTCDGSSFQGAGLKYVASNLGKGTTELVIASRTSGGMICGTAVGFPGSMVGNLRLEDDELNRWFVFDSSQEWPSDLEALVGPELVNQYNVYYLFGLGDGLRGKGDYARIRAKFLNSLSCIAEPLVEHFEEIRTGSGIIDPRRPTNTLGNGTVVDMRSISSAQKHDGTGTSGSGCNKLHVWPRAEFDACYLADGGLVDVLGDEFEFEIQPSGGSDCPRVVATFVPRAKVRVYPGTKANQFLANQRDHGARKSGNGSYPGEAPYVKGVLIPSFVGQEHGSSASMARFSQSAAYMTSNVAPVFCYMDLPYSDGGPAFATVEIDITRVWV